MRAQEIKRKRISHPIYLRKTNFITFDLFVLYTRNTSFLSLIGCIYDYLLLCGELKAFQMPLPSIKTRYYSSYRRTRKIAFIKLSFRFTKKCERRRTKNLSKRYNVATFDKTRICCENKILGCQEFAFFCISYKIQ